MPSSKNPQLRKRDRLLKLVLHDPLGRTGVVNRKSASGEQYRPLYRMMPDDRHSITISEAKKTL